MKNCDEQFLKISSNVTVLESFLKKSYNLYAVTNLAWSYLFNQSTRIYGIEKLFLRIIFNKVIEPLKKLNFHICNRYFFDHKVFESEAIMNIFVL